MLSLLIVVVCDICVTNICFFVVKPVAFSAVFLFFDRISLFEAIDGKLFL
jgi:hypothetical protein